MNNRWSSMASVDPCVGYSAPRDESKTAVVDGFNSFALDGGPGCSFGEIHPNVAVLRPPPRGAPQTSGVKPLSRMTGPQKS